MDSSYEIYQNIAKRNNGDLYIGVVGPVRTGKSTFIAKFMETLVLPNIGDEKERQRATDEIPQSGDGTTVMTTQPRFIPAKGCRVNLGENVMAKVRLVDSVGYMINGADAGVSSGDNKERLITTPWTEDDIPFSKAAEIGTRKVIADHSNIGVVVTSDGTATGIARPNYIEAEERCVKELKALKKPFVVVLNSSNPTSEQCEKLRMSLEQKYEVPVCAVNAKELNEKDIENIFAEVLHEFPFEKIEVKMPLWLEVLPLNNRYIQEIVMEVQKSGANMTKMGEFAKEALFNNSDNFEPASAMVLLDEGKILFNVVPKQELFYKVISEEAGITIENEFDLVYNLKELSRAKQSYDSIKEAMQMVEMDGYGIVNPSPEQMTLSEPEIVKNGNRYGVKLKASAPSLHLVKVDIETEINPILGTEAQSEELVKNMMEQFENDPQALWQTNIFGKSLYDLVNDGLKSKLDAMPVIARQKMRKTLGRIVNEGKGGVICILL